MQPTANPESHGFDSGRLDRVRRWAARYVDGGKLPCALTVIARDGEIVFTDMRGFADVGLGRSLAEDNLFRIFSMTKPVTSVAAMMLIEEGRLRLDDPVGRYIASFDDVRVLSAPGNDLGLTEPVAAPLTIHHLMTHTSGLTYGFFDPSSTLAESYQKGDLDMNPQGSPLDQWANDLARLPLAFQPGARWNYGVSSDLLGRIVEIIEERPLDEVFSDRIFEPLGMSETWFGVPAPAADRLTSLYKYNTNGGFSPMETGETSGFRAPVSRFQGGGGLVSRASDYLRFVEMLRRRGELDGARLLGARTVEFMTANHLGGDMESMGQPTFGESNFRGIGFGLGVAVVLDPAKAQLVTSPGEYFWGGAASTVFWVDPVQNLSVIFLTQLFPSSTYPLRQELRALVNQAVVDR